MTAALRGNRKAAGESGERSRAALGQTLLATVALQGVGALALFGAIAWLGAVHGPAPQGVFSKTKVLVEAAVAIAAFGLPQAYLYFVRSAQLSVGRAMLQSAVLSTAALSVSLAVLAASHDLLEATALAVAIGVLTAHSLLRALVLAASTTRKFNLVTAAPQVAVLVLVIGIFTWREVTIIAAATILTIPYSIATLLMIAVLWRVGNGSAAPQLRPIDLFQYSSASWLSASMSNATVLVLIIWAESGGGPIVLGVFGASVVVVQGALTPVNYSVPILFRHWADSRRPRKWSAALRAASPFAALSALCAWGSVQQIFPSIGDYQSMVPIIWLLLGIAALEVVIKVVGVGFLGMGRPWLPAIADCVRLVFTLAVILISSPDSISGLAWSWATGSALAALTLGLLSVRKSEGSGTTLPESELDLE